MHVPAYAPVVVGVQAVEYKGVLVAVKKVICMSMLENVVEDSKELSMSMSV